MSRHPSGKQQNFSEAAQCSDSFVCFCRLFTTSPVYITGSRPFRKEGLIAFLSISLNNFSEKKPNHFDTPVVTSKRHKNKKTTYDNQWPSFDFATESEIFRRYTFFFGWVLSDVCVSILLQLSCRIIPRQSPWYHRLHGCLRTMKSRVSVPSLKFRHRKP